MSDQLRLAKLLSQLSSEQLAHHIRASEAEPREHGDLLDLAGFLLQRKPLSQRLEGIGRVQLELLLSGSSDHSLREALLADEVAPFEATVDLAKKLAIKASSQVSPGDVDVSGSGVGGSQDEEPPVALVAQSIGQSIIALREIALSTDRNWLKIMKQGLRKPDAVAYSEYIHFAAEEIQRLFSMAVSVGLVAIEDERWATHDFGHRWATLPDLEAWAIVIEKMGADLAQLSGIRPGDALVGFLNREFPLLRADSNQVVRFGDLIGLSNRGHATSLLLLVLENKLDVAVAKLGAVWPAPTEKIIVQADQSITIPGPLRGSLHVELSVFADAIDIGLASRFRINKLSLSRGLESGLTGAEIAQRLRELSAGELPQPVHYLIEDAERTLRNIVVKPSGFGAVVDFVDRIDSVQVERDRELGPLGFFRSGETQLASRLKPEIVWVALREAGYAAVRVRPDGQILRWGTAGEPDQPANGIDVLALANRLLRTDLPELDDQNMLKQLQFAQKNRLPVGLVVRMADGTMLRFSALVTGVAETRVRVKDTAADTERTLPVSSIVDWTLG